MTMNDALSMIRNTGMDVVIGDAYGNYGYATTIGIEDDQIIIKVDNKHRLAKVDTRVAERVKEQR